MDGPRHRSRSVAWQPTRAGALRNARACSCADGFRRFARRITGRINRERRCSDRWSLIAGLGADDPCGRLDPDKVPRRAVDKLQAAPLNLPVLCAGTLVGPSTVLTAAHCVYSPRAQRNFLPETPHFLIGYDGSRHAGHGPAFDLRPGIATTPAGLRIREAAIAALVLLDTGLGLADRVLPVIGELPRSEAATSKIIR
jgi:Trypsin